MFCYVESTEVAAFALKKKLTDIITQKTELIFYVPS